MSSQGDALGCVSKVMEMCIFSHMYPLVESSLTEAQHGFMKHKSCTTQLLDLYHIEKSCQPSQ